MANKFLPEALEVWVYRSFVKPVRDVMIKVAGLTDVKVQG